MKKILILILTACLLAACSDDDEDDKNVITPIQPDKKLIPKEIFYVDEFNEIDTITFLYNENNLLKEIHEEKGDNKKYTYKLFYDNTGIIDSLSIINNSSEPKKYTFTYEDNKIHIKKNNTEKIFTVNKDGYAEYVYSAYSDWRERYEYNKNNNIINIYSYDKTLLSYDNHNGIFKYMNLPQWLLLSDLLPLSPWKYNYSSNVTERTYDGNYSTSSYVYNEEGYPVIVREEIIYYSDKLSTANLASNISYIEITD